MSRNRPTIDTVTIFDNTGKIVSRASDYTQVLRLTKDFGQAKLHKDSEPHSQLINWENGWGAVVLWK